MTTSNFVPLEAIRSGPGKNFFEKSEENPCNGCSAPCCRMLLIPHPTPSTFMDLDYIRYMVGFQNVEMILNQDGRWQVVIEQICQLLDQELNLCTVHNTPRKPKTCVFFNPYRCWYKRNFTTENPPEIIRIDIEAIETILERVHFDQNGNITEIPSWELIQELVNNGKGKLESRPSPEDLPLINSC